MCHCPVHSLIGPEGICQTDQDQCNTAAGSRELCAQVVMRDEGYLMHQTSLLNDPKYADMVLVAEGHHPHTGISEQRTFYCHRVILASRSTYFDLLFGSGKGATDTWLAATTLLLSKLF